MNQQSAGWARLSLPEEAFATYDILAADVSGDGRADILEANSDEINRYSFNFRPVRKN